MEFNTTIVEMTLYQRIHKINPDRTYEAITRRVRLFREKGWEKNKIRSLKKLRVGYLDIETTDLKANFGFMLSWCIKARDKKKIDYSLITKKEIFDGDTDKRLVVELFEAIKNYDVLYVHWGADRRFDVPFIRTRAFWHNLEHLLPNKFDKFVFDTWPIARNKLRLSSNRLDTIAEALGITDVRKTPLSTRQWQAAGMGNVKALKYILDHNKKDVIILEAVHKKLELVENKIYRSM